jgi:uncharacterized protein (DUF2237 family)
MTCDACLEAKTNPLTGLYRDGCKSCSARQLSRSIEHTQAKALGKMTPAYMARLREVSGDDWENLHKIVKEWAKVT